jgi:hypothetical protein
MQEKVGLKGELVSNVAGVIMVAGDLVIGFIDYANATLAPDRSL